MFFPSPKSADGLNVGVCCSLCERDRQDVNITSYRPNHLCGYHVIEERGYFTQPGVRAATLLKHVQAECAGYISH